MTPHIVVLAGGEGRRMKLGRPKALHPVFFRPMLHHVLDAAAAVPHRSLSVLFGPGEREMRERCRAYPDLLLVSQEAGGDAAEGLRGVEAYLEPADCDLLVLYGDAVLTSARSIAGLLAEHERSGAACTAGGAAAAEPTAYCFKARAFFAALASPGQPGRPVEGVLADAARAVAGGSVARYLYADPAEAWDVDDHYGLWRVERVLVERRNRELMLRGVSLQDPLTTLVDPGSRIAPGARIEGGCTVLNSALEAGVVLENFCRVVDSEVGRGSLLRQGTCLDGSRVGRDCRVGPYARVRAGSSLADDVWVGNFVEVKNATLGSGTRAAHLSFIGDATVGRNVNIGCGFITCNSSGRPLKHRTVVEDGVFIGSASQAVAPVTLGAGSFIATGTSVTEDVPPDSFVISRGRQVTKPGYAKKYGRPDSAGLGAL